MSSELGRGPLGEWVSSFTSTRKFCDWSIDAVSAWIPDTDTGSEQLVAGISI
jgi:hypothetical protein